MENQDDLIRSEINAQTTAIVSAYLSNNSLEATAVPALIRSVRAALAGQADAAPSDVAPADEPAAVEEERKPAVPVRKSVTPRAITCLECGKGFKSLKRHIGSAHGLSVAEYRERWDLSREYPMVAPEYSAMRAETVRKIGLGRKKKS